MIGSRLEKFHLGAWVEIIGELLEISSDEYSIYLKIDNKVLSFLKESIEAKYLQQILDDSVIGRKIAVLRTDISEKPLFIRLVD